MLTLSLHLLTERYIATSYYDRELSEWPPHPARIFSALASALFQGDEERSEVMAMQWLAQAGAPDIYASQATPGSGVMRYVPVNDQPQHLIGLLPEHRNRQARSFPSMLPEHPWVHYCWSSQPSDEVLAGLQQLALRVGRVGHSSSLSILKFARGALEHLDEQEYLSRFTPQESGSLSIRIPRENQLELLQDMFERHRGVNPRLLPYTLERYGHASHLSDQASKSHEVNGSETCFSKDWIVLRRTGGIRAEIDQAVSFTIALRRALMSFAEKQGALLPASISGHDSDGSRATCDHIAIVALPFCGSKHADGSVKGLAIIPPKTMTEGERVQLWELIDRWEEGERVDEEETPMLCLKMGKSGVMNLERVAWGAPMRSLKVETWTQEARRWATVTPVALDRHPGNLNHTNDAKRRKATRAVERSLRAALARVGAPDPVSIAFRQAPMVRGTAHVKRYPAYPPQRSKFRRVLLHVECVFEHPIRGPLMIGSGRYQGLGLFRPLNEGVV